MPALRILLATAALLFTGASGAQAASEVHRELFAHPTAPERQVELLWVEPEGEGPWPAILLVHGHQFPERPGGRAYLEWGRLQDLAKQGFLAAAVSQPGYGASDGPPDFCGPLSQEAVRGALARLRRHPRVDSRRLVLSGARRGAIVSSMVATVEPDLAALVLRGGIYDLEDAYHRMDDDFGGKHNLEKEAGTSKQAFLDRSALRAPKEIHVPTLIFHGEDDPISPVDHARRLAQRIHSAGTPVKLTVFRDTGHRIPWEQREDILWSFLQTAFAPSAAETNLDCDPHPPSRTEKRESLAWG